MSGLNFDVIVACKGGDIASVDAGLAELVRTKGYAYKKVDEGGGWVKWHFTGTVAKGELSPWDYMMVQEYLVGKGCKEMLTPWGAYRFEKD